MVTYFTYNSLFLLFEKHSLNFSSLSHTSKAPTTIFYYTHNGKNNNSRWKHNTTKVHNSLLCLIFPYKIISLLHRQKSFHFSPLSKAHSSLHHQLPFCRLNTICLQCFLFVYFIHLELPFFNCILSFLCVSKHKNMYDKVM